MDKSLHLFLILLLTICYCFVNGKVEQAEVSGSKLLYIFEANKNWLEAYKFCRTRGYYLLTINNEQEYQQVKNLVNGLSLLDTKSIWTSGTDLGSEGKFYWMSTGKEVKYANWSEGNPDNANNTQHCVLYTGKSLNYTINDYECDSENYFICETY